LRKGELEFHNAQNTENAISFFADVPQFDDNTQRKQHETQIFPNAGAPIDDAV